MAKRTTVDSLTPTSSPIRPLSNRLPGHNDGEYTGQSPVVLAHGADARLDPIHQAVARSIHARFLPVVVFSPNIGNRLQVSNQNPSFYSL
jgi:hypothetical protein